MSSSVPPPPPPAFTTNAEDQKAAAEMQARLQANNNNNSSQQRRHGFRPSLMTTTGRLPSVHIDPGVHKYVLLRAMYIMEDDDKNSNNNNNSEFQYFVTSRQGAAYHRDAAEPMIEQLETHGGYTDIEVQGGGRIDCQMQSKTMSIFGFSYGFGRADHSISQRVVQEDPKYQGFEVSTSNEGY